MLKSWIKQNNNTRKRGNNNIKRSFTLPLSSSKPGEEEYIPLALANAGGGDCLFFAYGSALRQAFPGRDREQFEPAALRRAVASQLEEEHFDFYRNVASADPDSSSWARDLKDLEDMKARVLRRSYWGDQLSLLLLEKYFGVRSVVIRFDRGEPPHVAPYSGLGMPELPPRGFVVLSLRGQHYEVIVGEQGQAWHESRTSAKDLASLVLRRGWMNHRFDTQSP